MNPGRRSGSFDLCELLAACVHGKSVDDSVITREDGKPVRDFRDKWVKVSKAAGVPGLLFHDLRRTAARNLRRAGVAENVIMQIGGWRTRSVFDRYAIITENDIVDAVRKLEADRKQREIAMVEISAISHEINRSANSDCKRKAAKLGCVITFRLGRDGGTGRRSGLKIRRASALGGSIPPPGTRFKPFRIIRFVATGCSGGKLNPTRGTSFSVKQCCRYLPRGDAADFPGWPEARRIVTPLRAGYTGMQELGFLRSVPKW